MHNIIFDNVSKSYGNKEVIKQLNFEIQEGERVVFLGPSGCGKSTTLRLVAGFEDITDGKLFMGGTCVNHMAPGKRNIAMVFQSYALFPHMDVWENIIFGLKIQKLGKKEIERRAKDALEMLHLDGFEQRLVKSLSGGQKQRVALCRAIVKQSPYFLLDEPLSNLDAQLRQQARQNLVRIHEINKSTMIYVTHDQVEAMTMGDRLAVMKDGIIEQLATPAVAYEFPANLFVAGFIGSPAMNFIPVNVTELDAEHVKISGQNLLFTLSRPSAAQEMDGFKGQDMLLGVRPESIALVEEDTRAQKGDWQPINAMIDVVEPSGSRTFVHMTIAGQDVISEADTIKVMHLQGHTEVTVWFNTSHVHLFDPTSEKRIMSTAQDKL